MGNVITGRDMCDQVKASLFEQADGYNIEAIVDEIKVKYGLIDINTLGDGGAYWDIVERHAFEHAANAPDGNEERWNHAGVPLEDR